jgi:hypothetical protein
MTLGSKEHTNTQILVYNVILQLKELMLFGEMVILGLGKKIYNMSLGHHMAPRTKK